MGDNRSNLVDSFSNGLILCFRFFHRLRNTGCLIDELMPDLIYEAFPDLLKRSELINLKEDDNPVIGLYALKD